MFNSLYTLYWPLPVAFDRACRSWARIAFAVGAAIIMVNILLFAFNLFSTVLSKSNPHSYSFWEFLRSAFGINRAAEAGWARRTRAHPTSITMACRCSWSPWGAARSTR